MKNHSERKTCAKKSCMLISFLIFSMLPCLNANPVISTYGGDFIFKFKTSEKTYDIKVYYYCPKRFTPTSRIVFVLHSDNRSGVAYRNEWSKYTEDNDFLLVCPEFTEKDFPYMRYNLGNIYNQEKKKFNPKDDWTFSAIEKLFDFVREDTKSKVNSYCIFGHSSVPNSSRGWCYLCLKQGFRPPSPMVQAGLQCRISSKILIWESGRPR